MNTQNVKKMTANVNYVKPEMEMVEIETEGNLLLTASVNADPMKSGANGAAQVSNGSNFTVSRRN